MVKKIIFPILTIIWMLVIFLFSAQVAEDSGNLSNSIVGTIVNIIYGNKFENYPLDKQETILNTFSLIIRKGAHFTEYGILGSLVFFSITSYYKTNYAYLISIVFSFLYAGTDEIHQTFVEGRAGRFTDVLIDTSGALFFLGIIFIISLLIKKHKNKKVS